MFAPFHPLTSVPQVTGAVNQGILIIVAAGNGSKNADDVSPAHVAGTITVGATTIADTFAPFSNHGTKVTTLAPGVLIGGPNFNGDGDVLRSGTSFAA